MLILSRVCAQFHNAQGETLFSVTPAMRNIFTEAPETIREDPLFDLLAADGSMEVAVTAVQKKLLENDPMKGTDASGKKAEAEKTDMPVRTKTRGKAAGTADASVPEAGEAQ